MIPLIRSAANAISQIVPPDIKVTGEEEVRVEGTGSVIVQVLHGGQWAQPTLHTDRMEVIHINCFADVVRDIYGNPTDPNSDSRAYATYEIIDGLLHDIARRSPFLSSYRASGPAITYVPNGDGAVMLTARYEVRTR